jgi:RNA 3'-terminal phosphate cyclase (ATP)
MMPASAFAPEPVEIHLVGGTDVKWSPTIDYMRHVVLPNLALAGYEAEMVLERRGHYPKGGGKVTMRIRNVGSVKPVRLVERGSFSSIEGISHCVKLPSHVAQRQAEMAKERLADFGYGNVNIAVETYPSNQDPHLGPGSGIALFTRADAGCVLGSDSLGERGKPAEKVGDEAAWKLHQELQSKAPFDRHMADIIIPYLAVAEGRSEILLSQLTMHAVTNIQITERVSEVKFQVEGELGTPARISVDGKPPSPK